MPYRGKTGLILLLLVLLPACTGREMLFNGGSAAGEAVMQQRGFSGATSDYRLRLAISEAWFHYSIDLFQRASLMISEGDVLIIGRVPDDLTRFQAALLAREAGANRLTNALTTGPDFSWQQKLQDSAITGQIESALVFDADVSALNYDVETRGGIVYLTGEAASTRELRRVSFIAANTKGVVRVENHVHLPESR